MDWITETLALGNWQDARDGQGLHQAGVGAVLQLYGPDPRPDVQSFPGALLQLHVIDARPLDPERLDEGLAFIRDQLALGRKVLVCCGAGMSRSPTFVAAHLYEQGEDLESAYLRVVAQRRGILPHPHLLRSLIERYGAALTPETLLTAIVRARSHAASRSVQARE